MPKMRHYLRIGMARATDVPEVFASKDARPPANKIAGQWMYHFGGLLSAHRRRRLRFGKIYPDPSQHPARRGDGSGGLS